MKDLINSNVNIVPDNKILYFYDNRQAGESFSHQIFDIVEPLKGNINRDWFDDEYYYFLSLVIANQYGFVLKAAEDLEFFYNGGDAPATIKVGDGLHPANTNRVQRYYNNFFNGVISIENNFQIKTPPKVNLIIMQPPNYFIDGISTISSVIETDNLSKAFTFQIKITQTNKKVKIKKGQWLAAFIPIPRFFVDSFSLEPAEKYIKEIAIQNEQEASKQLVYQTINSMKYNRDIEKRNESEKKYFDGLHFDNTPFYNEHQKGFKKND